MAASKIFTQSSYGIRDSQSGDSGAFGLYYDTKAKALAAAKRGNYVNPKVYVEKFKYQISKTGKIKIVG